MSILKATCTGHPTRGCTVPLQLHGSHIYKPATLTSQHHPHSLATAACVASPLQVKLVGKQRLVLDLSCRQRDGQYYVVTDRWQRFSSLALSEETLATLAGSCDEFLVHGVDVEGMQLGIDDALVELLGRWSPIPVTYAGGARTLVRGHAGRVTVA